MSENQKHPLFFPVGFSVWFCAASVSFQKLVNPASNFGILQTQKQLAGKFQEVDLVFRSSKPTWVPRGTWGWVFQAERLVSQEKISRKRPSRRDYGGFALFQYFRETSVSFSLLSWKGKAKSTLLFLKRYSCNSLVFRLLLVPQGNWESPKQGITNHFWI